MPTKAKISHRIAHVFSSTIIVSHLHETLYSVIEYPVMKGNGTSVIDSKSFKKSLSKIKYHNVVAVAHGFTAESHKIAEQKNVILFYKSDFFWTDKSWANIRDQQK